MNDPRKHHYNPAFYLSQWTRPDGELAEIKKVYGKVEARSKHPNATGFQRDLYRTEGIPEEHAQHLEKNFMAPLDNGASKELARMLTGDGRPSTSEERSAWTRFVISLLFRHPAAVAVMKDHVAEMWKEATDALEADYAARRGSDDPPTFAAATASRHPGAANIDATNMLAEIIDNDRVGPTIFKMKWVVVDVSQSKHTLLTSDRPVVMPYGLGNPNANIALPLSPTKLFVAAYDDRFAKKFPSVNPTEVVKVINKSVVVQARQFVWSIDDSQLDFVKKHMGSAPEREIITEEQRQATIKSARGMG